MSGQPVDGTLKILHGWVELQCCRARFGQKAVAALMGEGAVIILYGNDARVVKALVAVICRE